MDDIRCLSGPAFFKLAFRLGAYQGVIAARMAGQVRQEEPGPAPSWSPPGQQGLASRPQPGPATREGLEAFERELQAKAPGMGSLFSFSTVKRDG